MDFSDDCKELTFGQLLCEVLYRASMKTRSRNISDARHFSPHSEDQGTVSKSQERIKDIIASSHPLMMARFGAVELGAFLNYLQVNGKTKDAPQYSLLRYLRDECYPKWYSIATRTCFSRQAGFSVFK